MMYASVLDACVLFPNTLRDTILTIAETGLFQPLWSSEILHETRRSIIAHRHRTSPQAIDRMLGSMNDAFEGARIEGWEPLVAGLDLPDPNDRHVLAAAIAGGAQSIATFNLRDFPEKALAQHAVAAMHPDEFLLDQLDLAPPVVLRALAKQAARYRNPPTDRRMLLDRKRHV